MQDLKEFFDARDDFITGATPMFELGFCALARCRHPEARKVVALFKGVCPRSVEEALQIFSECPDRVFAIGYLAMINWMNDTLINEGMRLGNAYCMAQSRDFEILKRAADLGERYAYFALGDIFRKQNRMSEALAMYKTAAFMGLGDAAYYYGKYGFALGERERYPWLIQAFKTGYAECLVKGINRCSGDEDTLCYIGS